VPKVFGVLSIVFASIVLLFGLMQSCTGFASRGIMSYADKLSTEAQNSAEVKASMAHMADVYFGMGLQGVILTVMSAFLLAIGIGQVRYRMWARLWTLYWGGAALAGVVAMVAISFLVIGPAYEQFFKAMQSSTPTGSMPAGLGGGMGTIFGGATGVMTVLFYAPYPILLLLFFSRDKVREAMVR
jgi:hypothetical protein